MQSHRSTSQNWYDILSWHLILVPVFFWWRHFVDANLKYHYLFRNYHNGDAQIRWVKHLSTLPFWLCLLHSLRIGPGSRNSGNKYHWVDILISPHTAQRFCNWYWVQVLFPFTYPLGKNGSKIRRLNFKRNPNAIIYNLKSNNSDQLESEYVSK